MMLTSTRRHLHTVAIIWASANMHPMNLILITTYGIAAAKWDVMRYSKIVKEVASNLMCAIEMYA